MPPKRGVSSLVTLDHERELFAQGFERVAGLDEVGTGAAAGPCYCALVVVSAVSLGAPVGLNDSKLLSARQREGLVPAITSWALDWSLGRASAGEIDEYGLTIALRLAGHRALAALRVAPDIVILDGKRDWLTIPSSASLLAPDYGSSLRPEVRTMVKADRHCASVAAASILAKVERDRIMGELALEFPEYEWGSNKGYLSAAHQAAISANGLSPHHRASWALSS